MIFYQIQAAYNLDYLRDLVSFIYHPQNYYFITLDKSQEAHAARVADFFTPFENVAVYSGSHITWGGVSQVNSMLIGMNFMRQVAHEGLRACRYYVNLSDSDLPLWTQETLIQHLERAEKNNRLAFMQHWSRPVDFDALPTTEARDGFQFSQRKDIRFQVHNSMAAHFKSGDANNPIMRPLLRPLIVAFEQPVEKVVYLRPMTAIERMTRERFFGEFPMWFGRQWLILHATVIDRMFSNSRFLEFYKMIADIFIPDEGFFQSAVWHTIGDTRQIVGNNLRYKDGGPAALTDAVQDELAKSPAAFARKVVFPQAQRLLENARTRFAEEIATFERDRASRPAAPREPATPSPHRWCPAVAVGA
jgi:hypothetical protein